MMHYRRLGRTGLKVSCIGLGCMSFGSSAWRDWVLDRDDARPLLAQAFEAGINFFDTANVYSHGNSEKLLGQFVNELGIRDQVVISTKAGFPTGLGPTQAGLSRKAVFAALDASLMRLQTDYVDIFQIHQWDAETPIDETMEALDDVVRAGKARYLGGSNMRGWQLAKGHFTAKAAGWAGFASMQVHYNLLHREDERELIPLSIDQGIGLLPWSPLARGRLARAGQPSAATARGKIDDVADTLYGTSKDPILTELAGVARDHGVPPAQVAIAWLSHKPGVTAPIVGVTKESQLEDAVASASLQLTAKDMNRLERSYTARPLSELPQNAKNQNDIWDQNKPGR